MTSGSVTVRRESRSVIGPNYWQLSSTRMLKLDGRPTASTPLACERSRTVAFYLWSACAANCWLVRNETEHERVWLERNESRGSNPMPIEPELKFRIPEAMLGSVAGMRIRGARAEAGSERKLVSTYFDTPKQRLRRHGLTLRVRNSDGEFRQTVKSAAVRRFCARRMGSEGERCVADARWAKEDAFGTTCDEKAEAKARAGLPNFGRSDGSPPARWNERSRIGCRPRYHRSGPTDATDLGVRTRIDQGADG